MNGCHSQLRGATRLQVVVFSWTACPFCKKAKALLRDLGADFTAVELDQMGSEGSALRCELARVRAECTGLQSQRQPDGEGVKRLPASAPCTQRTALTRFCLRRR